jgi:hypothetical protein
MAQRMIRRFAFVLALLLPFAALARQPDKAPPAPLVEGIDYEALEQPGTLLADQAGRGRERRDLRLHLPALRALRADGGGVEGQGCRRNIVLRLTSPGLQRRRSAGGARTSPPKQIGTLGLTHLQTFQAIHETRSCCRTIPPTPNSHRLLRHARP